MRLQHVTVKAWTGKCRLGNEYAICTVCCSFPAVTCCCLTCVFGCKVFCVFLFFFFVHVILGIFCWASPWPKRGVFLALGGIFAVVAWPERGQTAVFRGAPEWYVVGGPSQGQRSLVGWAFC